VEIIQQFYEQQKTYVALVGGALLGLVVGLAIGWWLWPVQYGNLTPAQLRPDFQDDYIIWVAQNYPANGGVEWAQAKLGAQFWKEGQLGAKLDELALKYGGETALHLRTLSAALEVTPETSAEVTTPPGPVIANVLRPALMFCGVTLLVLAVVGGGLVLVTRWRATKLRGGVGDNMGIPDIFATSDEDLLVDEEAPTGQFVTTYQLGDDHYDPSFSIELASGEFMGECGVGISETIGVGEPNKVTAFELWLFDKNDIRTVTKVLLSEYAFDDEALRTKLAPKGEPMLADTSSDIILETKRIRVQARVVEVVYGTGNLPGNSFFERLTIDLTAWVKAGSTELPPVEEDDAGFMPSAL